MTSNDDDPYSSFCTAFERQRVELDCLHGRVSELEKMNSEVLSFVHKTGMLPGLGCSGCFSERTQCDQASSNRCSFTDNFGYNSGQHELSCTPQPTFHEHHVHSEPNLVSILIDQQTVSLCTALKNLGLDPSEQSELLGRVQTNLAMILSEQLAGSSQKFFPNSASYVPSSHLMNATSTGTNESPSRVIHESFCHANQLSMVEATEQSFGGSTVGSDKTSLMNERPVTTGPCDAFSTRVRERRIHELTRVNQRYGDREHKLIRPIAGDECNTADNIRFPRTAAFDVLNDQTGAHITTNSATTHPALDFYCPCATPRNCPLDLFKQRCLTENKRVINGFIRMVAVFRGRFIRHLLTTSKVINLIRTIKDTAKLALSIHSECCALQRKQHSPSNTEASCAKSTIEEPSLDSPVYEEVVLEARLLAQLRGSLLQLHDIFHHWSLSKQLELLASSRSTVPRRTPSTLCLTRFAPDHSLSSSGSQCSIRNGNRPIFSDVIDSIKLRQARILRNDVECTNTTLSEVCNTEAHFEFKAQIYRKRPSDRKHEPMQQIQQFEANQFNFDQTQGQFSQSDIQSTGTGSISVPKNCDSQKSISNTRIHEVTIGTAEPWTSYLSEQASSGRTNSIRAETNKLPTSPVSTQPNSVSKLHNRESAPRSDSTCPSFRKQINTLTNESRKSSVVSTNDKQWNSHTSSSLLHVRGTTRRGSVLHKRQEANTSTPFTVLSKFERTGNTNCNFGTNSTSSVVQSSEPNKFDQFRGRHQSIRRNVLQTRPLLERNRGETGVPGSQLTTKASMVSPSSSNSDRFQTADDRPLTNSKLLTSVKNRVTIPNNPSHMDQARGLWYPVIHRITSTKKQIPREEYICERMTNVDDSERLNGRPKSSALFCIDHPAQIKPQKVALRSTWTLESGLLSMGTQENIPPERTSN